MSVDDAQRTTAAQGGMPFDPEIQAILDRAAQRRRNSLQTERDFEAQEQRLRRAWNAWDEVCSFRGEAIPADLTGQALWKRYAELIVELGKVLKADGWQSRVDAVKPGDDAKTYALFVLRKAIDGDVVTVGTMIGAGVDNLSQFGLRADEWLREGLRYEVLDVQLPPEPPVGWEGPYCEAVDSAGDFIKWIDAELLVSEMFDRGQGNRASDGSSVRNAFRLVMKLDLKGMPLELTGPFTLNDELAVLRNLRRLLTNLDEQTMFVQRSKPGSLEKDHDQAGTAQAKKADAECTSDQASGEEGQKGQQWVTVTDAARACGCNPGKITKAVNQGLLKSNGKKKRDRRIDAADLTVWQIRRAKRGKTTESEEAVEQKLKCARGE
jgi:hypothetical protein